MRKKQSTLICPPVRSTRRQGETEDRRVTEASRTGRSCKRQCREIFARHETTTASDPWTHTRSADIAARRADPRPRSQLGGCRPRIHQGEVAEGTRQDDSAYYSLYGRSGPALRSDSGH